MNNSLKLLKQYEKTINEYEEFLRTRDIFFNNIELKKNNDIIQNINNSFKIIRKYNIIINDYINKFPTEYKYTFCKNIIDKLYKFKNNQTIFDTDYKIILNIIKILNGIGYNLKIHKKNNLYYLLLK